MRAQLMELTAARRWVLLISGSAKSALTKSWISISCVMTVYMQCLHTWQSSKVPSTAKLCTFASRTVVICAS